MAAAWGSWREKSFRLFSWFSAARVGEKNKNIFKPYLNHSNVFTRLQPKIPVSQQNRLFHMQYRYFRIQCCKPSQSHVLLQHIHQKVQMTSNLTSRLQGTFGKGYGAGSVVLCRGITMVSKKGKRKTCKAVAKRFIRTGKGKLKRWRCGKHHNQSKKSNRRKRFLRKPTYASKTQLKTLNKMLNGW